jgi:hypothetical protein
MGYGMDEGGGGAMESALAGATSFAFIRFDAV